MPKRNTSGLINFKDMTPEQRREISSKGGKAVQAKKKERKKLAEELIALLSEGDIQKEMCLALINSVINTGNATAFEKIRDTIGEKPKDEVVVSMTDTEAREEALDEALKKLGLKNDGSGKA